MRKKIYQTHWSLRGFGIRRGPIYKILLDYPWSFQRSDFDGLGGPEIIPSYEVINELFMSGGNSGGMSPGATWRPFSIKKEEYVEIVDTLMNLDTSAVKEKHPYCPNKFMIDKELNENYPDAEDWRKKWILKYRGLDGSILFDLMKDYPLYFQDAIIAKIRVTGTARGGKNSGLLIANGNFSLSGQWKKCKIDKGYYLNEDDWSKPSSVQGFKIRDDFGTYRSLNQLFMNEKNQVAFQPILEPSEYIPEIKQRDQ